jgi:hypothetical protein
MTKTDRRCAAERLDTMWDRWLKMSDSQLLAEVKDKVGLVDVSLTRDETLRFLTMHYVYIAFETTWLSGGRQK